jgi:hypothetical protein
VQREHPVTTPPVAPPPPARDRLSTTAFVLGLVSALTGVLYFVAVPVGLVGLVVSVVALRRRTVVRRVALGGLLLSLVGLVVGLGVIAFLVLDDDARTTTVDGIKSDTGDDEFPPQRDLEPDIACATDVDSLRASGVVRNRTDEVANYTLFAAWDRDGHQVAQAETKVDAVPPGATRQWEITVMLRGDASDTADCSIIRINRTSP